jgi:hypothetical protein
MTANYRSLHGSLHAHDSVVIQSSDDITSGRVSLDLSSFSTLKLTFSEACTALVLVVHVVEALQLEAVEEPDVAGDVTVEQLAVVEAAVLVVGRRLQLWWW